MIEFNLLPDVKLQYIKTNRLKRLVVAISVLAVAVSVTILVILLLVEGLQKKHIHDLNNDIANAKKQVLGIHDINKILTVQNQLAALPGIDAQKPVTSRLFSYLEAITPTNVSLNKASFDFTQNTLDLGGNAASLAAVDQFVDTLKFTTYASSSNDTSNTTPFTKVVLSQFSVSGDATIYEVQASFNPAIFDVKNPSGKLNVPPKITTRSITDAPNSNDLFQQSSTGSTGTQ